MKQFPILYSRDSKQNIRIWQMEQDQDKYRTISGIQGSENLITSEWTVATAKNEGKSNQTDPIEQAVKEINSKYADQLATNYHKSIEDIDRQLFFSPQLAKSYEDRREKIDWSQGIYISSKIDGLRCIIHKDGMFSRNGKPIVAAPHIFNSLKHIFTTYPNLILDSELYCDRLSHDFNKIISLARKTKPTDDDLVESEKFLQAWTFDIPSYQFPFCDRIVKLQEVLKEINSPYLRYIGHKLVNSHEEVEIALADYLSQGLEGVMLNLPNANYEQKRSVGLIKFKKFQDCEAEIQDIVAGQGNRSGMFGYAKLKLDNGIEFDANARGNEILYKKILANKDKYIGTRVTVRYQNLTPDKQIPRFPVIIDINGRFD